GDYLPPEVYGRSRSSSEADRVNGVFDEVVGYPVINPFAFLYAFYYDDLDIWDFDDRGTLNVVHQFLRELGVRWYQPGELGEVVPEMSTLLLPPAGNTVVEPEFPVRCMTRWSSRVKPNGDELRWRLRLG